MNYLIDRLISTSENKYDLTEAIALKAKDLKNNSDITLGYEAINVAIDACHQAQEEQKED